MPGRPFRASISSPESSAIAQVLQAVARVVAFFIAFSRKLFPSSSTSDKEEGFVKLLKKYDGSLFTVEKNEIKIDWHFFDKIFSRAWSQTNAEEKYALEFILKVLDIFNSSPDKNWLIVAERGAVLNPLGIDSILYFRRKRYLRVC